MRRKLSILKIIFEIFLCQTSSTISNLKNVGVELFITILDQKLQLWAQNQFSNVSGFSGFPYIKSLRKRGGKSKIRKISRFQTDVKIALVEEFRWNLCQMKALGLIFQDFLEFWIFDCFCMFYSTLNLDQIRIFENDGKHQICSVWLHVFSKN